MPVTFGRRGPERPDAEPPNPENTIQAWHKKEIDFFTRESDLLVNALARLELTHNFKESITRSFRDGSAPSGRILISTKDAQKGSLTLPGTQNLICQCDELTITRQNPSMVGEPDTYKFSLTLSRPKRSEEIISPYDLMFILQVKGEAAGAAFLVSGVRCLNSGAAVDEELWRNILKKLSENGTRN